MKSAIGLPAFIGGPPRDGYEGPSIYVSGPDAKRLADLNQYGLKLLVMDAPVGAVMGAMNKR